MYKEGLTFIDFVSNKPTDWSKCFHNIHTSKSRRYWRQTENLSLCAYKYHSRSASNIYTDICTKNMGHESESQRVWFHAGSFGSAEAAQGTRAHNSFWLPVGDQNECCIGSVSKTLKAVDVAPDNMTPPFPEGGPGGLKKTKSTILYISSHGNKSQTVLRYHSTTGTFILLTSDSLCHYEQSSIYTSFHLISWTCLIGQFFHHKSHKTELWAWRKHSERTGVRYDINTSSWTFLTRSTCKNVPTSSTKNTSIYIYLFIHSQPVAQIATVTALGYACIHLNLEPKVLLLVRRLAVGCDERVAAAPRPPAGASRRESTRSPIFYVTAT